MQLQRCLWGDYFFDPKVSKNGYSSASQLQGGKDSQGFSQAEWRTSNVFRLVSEKSLGVLCCHYRQEHSTVGCYDLFSASSGDALLECFALFEWFGSDSSKGLENSGDFSILRCVRFHVLQDMNAILTAVLSRWLPLSSAVLRTVTEKIPDPVSCLLGTVCLLIGN
jgi:hypothetical protein